MYFSSYQSILDIWIIVHNNLFTFFVFRLPSLLSNVMINFLKRVVPILIPVSEIPPIPHKTLASGSASS